MKRKWEEMKRRELKGVLKGRGSVQKREREDEGKEALEVEEKGGKIGKKGV